MNPTAPPPSSGKREFKPQITRAATVFVGLVWAAMLVAVLALVGTYGTQTLPQSDELWALYDAGPGIDVAWLWRTWAEHRIPLAKLIWKSVLEVTGYDFRAGNFLTALLLASVALAMIWTARRIRGRTILADAVFPLAVMNFGQAQVFLWWWQINHVLAPVVASLLMLLLVVHGNDLQPRHTVLLGAGMILLVLCGPGGLPYVVALAVFLLGRRESWVALGLVGLYFVDYQPYFPVNDPPTLSSWPESPGLAATGLAGLRILALSLGTATKPYAVAWGLGVLACGLVTARMLMLMKVARDRRAFGLGLLLAAQAGLVGIVAWSRAGMGVDYLYFGHYLTLVAPALCGMYFVWEIYGGRLGRALQVGMLAVLAVLVPGSFRQAVAIGSDVRARTEALEHDVRRGMPAFVLAEKHFSSDVVPRAAKITEMLKAHKANGVGVFAEIREDPEYEVESLPLPGARHVYAVRLRYRYVTAENPWPTIQVSWKGPGVEGSMASTMPGPETPTWALVDGKIQVDAKVRTERVLTVWVDAVVDEVRVVPDGQPAELRVSSVEVLVER
jgi:hypothetical protein